jgi:hypothetical protein
MVNGMAFILNYGKEAAFTVNESGKAFIPKESV